MGKGRSGEKAERQKLPLLEIDGKAHFYFCLLFLFSVCELVSINEGMEG